MESILRFTRTLAYPRKFIVADLNHMLHFKWLIRYQRITLGKTKAVQSLKKIASRDTTVIKLFETSKSPKYKLI